MPHIRIKDKKIKDKNFQYLGEPRVKPPNVVAGLSVCQGYDAKKAMEVRFICFLFEVWISIIEIMIQSIFSSCSWNGRGLDACTSTLWLKTWSMSASSSEFSWQSFKLHHNIVFLRSIIRRWHNALFTDDIKKKLGITERQVDNKKT